MVALTHLSLPLLVLAGHSLPVPAIARGLDHGWDSLKRLYEIFKHTPEWTQLNIERNDPPMLDGMDVEIQLQAHGARELEELRVAFRDGETDGDRQLVRDPSLEDNLSFDGDLFPEDD